MLRERVGGRGRGSKDDPGPPALLAAPQYKKKAGVMKFLAACAAPGSSSNRARDPQERGSARTGPTMEAWQRESSAASIQHQLWDRVQHGPGRPAKNKNSGDPARLSGKRAVTKGQSGLWRKGQGAAPRAGGRLEDEIRNAKHRRATPTPCANGAPEGSRAQLIKRWCSSKITSSSSPRSTSRSPSYMTTPVSHW